MRNASLEWSRLLLARFQTLSEGLLPGQGQREISESTLAWLQGKGETTARRARAQAIDDELKAARKRAQHEANQDDTGRWAQLFGWLAADELEADLLCLLVTLDAHPQIASSVRLLSRWPEAAGVEKAFLQALLDPFGEQLEATLALLSSAHRLGRMGAVRGLSHGDASRARFIDLAPALLIWLNQGVSAACEATDGLEWSPPKPLSTDEDACLAALEGPQALADQLMTHHRLHLNGGGPGDAELVARLSARAHGAGCVTLDAETAPSDPHRWRESARAAGLLAGLEAGWLIVKGLDKGADELRTLRKNALTPLIDALACPLILIDEAPESLAGSSRTLASEVKARSFNVTFPDTTRRRTLWAALKGDEETAGGLEGFALGVDQIHAISSAPVSPSDPPIEERCREAVSHRVGTLAERVRSIVTWDDIVLPEPVLEVAQHLLVYARESERVFERWGYGAKHAYGIGLSALFSGPPGTGKTMLAGLLASELGIDLFKIDLSRVVSKYIGETEERLARLFDEARRGGVALLFDEADSLFAKRTSVSSSTDRYANLEVNFLLQKMEDFEGIVFLTTNMPDSLDEAFKRRIRFHAKFPLPDVADRERLWRALTPTNAPLGDDVNFAALAEAYEFSGGDVKNASLRAAFYAAAADGVITLELLDKAAEVECRERGRLALRSAFDYV